MSRLDVAECFKAPTKESVDSTLNHACIKLNQMLHVVLHQEQLLRTQAKDIQIALKEIVLGKSVNNSVLQAVSGKCNIYLQYRLFCLEYQNI
jgi:hypothetical protein